MKLLSVYQTQIVGAGGAIEDAAIERFELGYWGMLIGACVSAKYIGEVVLFPWLTVPSSLTTIAGGMIGAHIGSHCAQLHFNAVTTTEV
jgi:hypothetical protein